MYSVHVCVCVCACEHACVHACVCACVGERGRFLTSLLLQHSSAVLQELKLVGDPIVKSVCKHQRSISKSQIVAFFSATALNFFSQILWL